MTGEKNGTQRSRKSDELEWSSKRSWQKKTIERSGRRQSTAGTERRARDN